MTYDQLCKFMGKKADEWIKQKKINLDSTYKDVDKLFRAEISETANDIFVDKMFNMLSQRYEDVKAMDNVKPGQEKGL